MTKELRSNGDEAERPQEPSFLQTTGGGLELPATGAPLRSRVARNNSVYLVIDCSHSMEGNKLKWAKEGAVEFAQDARTKGYQSGLISFAASARHICEPQDDPMRLRDFVRNLRVAPYTNMRAAIQLATRSLKILDGRKVMAIVTDGEPYNREGTLVAAREGTLVAAREAKREGIDIITLGTEDADYAFLRLIASRDDLAAVTHTERLTEGIRSMAKMLPEGTRH